VVANPLRLLGVSIIHMDEFIDQLLHEDRCCNVIMPFLPKRWILENAGTLEPRVSIVQDIIDAEEAALAAERAEQEQEPKRKREVWHALIVAPCEPIDLQSLRALSLSLCVCVSLV
jgi:hypothetical protein